MAQHVTGPTPATDWAWGTGGAQAERAPSVAPSVADTTTDIEPADEDDWAVPTIEHEEPISHDKAELRAQQYQGLPMTTSVLTTQAIHEPYGISASGSIECVKLVGLDNYAVSICWRNTPERQTCRRNRSASKC